MRAIMGDMNLEKEKSEIIKWLMALTILLSLFAFSGYVSEYTICQKRPARREIRISTNINNKRTVSFTKLLKELEPIPVYPNHWSDQVSVKLSQYERLIKTKFDCNARRLISFRKPDKILTTRYTPRNTADISSSISKG
jgi:hypothetical protein